jgi:hypothetical protein
LNASPGARDSVELATEDTPQASDSIARHATRDRRLTLTHMARTVTSCPSNVNAAHTCNGATSHHVESLKVITSSDREHLHVSDFRHEEDRMLSGVRPMSFRLTGQETSDSVARVGTEEMADGQWVMVDEESFRTPALQ